MQLPAGTAVDVVLFDRLAGRALARALDDPAFDAEAREALALLGGELLPAERYAPWATSSRERLRRRHLALLDRLADVAAPDEALRLLELAIDLDRYDEHRYLNAGRIAFAAERAGLTRRLLRGAEAALAELDLAPGAEWHRLDRELRPRFGR